MKTCCLLTVVGFIALSATIGAASLAEDPTVAYAKTLPASRLDKHLPSLPLDKWLRSGPPHLDDVSWEMDEDCGMDPEYRDPLVKQRPLCVKFEFRRSGPGDPFDGWGIIQVGTVGQGIVGSPQFRGFKVNVPFQGYVTPSPPFQGYMESLRLEDLPSILSEASAIGYARNLDVRQLDATLPSMRLEDWLRSGPAGIETVLWRPSPTCDLKDPEPLSTDNSDWAACVKFVLPYKGLSESPAYVEGLITIGTVRKGVTGPPRFEHFGFLDNGFWQRNPSWVPNFDTDKLSNLFRALTELSSR